MFHVASALGMGKEGMGRGRMGLGGRIGWIKDRDEGEQVDL